MDWQEIHTRSLTSPSVSPEQASQVQCENHSVEMKLCSCPNQASILGPGVGTSLRHQWWVLEEHTLNWCTLNQLPPPPPQYLRVCLAIFKLCVYHKLKCATHFKDVCESKLYSVRVFKCSKMCVNCIVFTWKSGLFRDTPVKMRLLVCVLIPYDWCPWTKREHLHVENDTYTGRLGKRLRGQCEEWVGVKHIQTKDHQISKQIPRN